MTRFRSNPTRYHSRQLPVSPHFVSPDSRSREDAKFNANESISYEVITLRFPSLEQETKSWNVLIQRMECTKPLVKKKLT